MPGGIICACPLVLALPLPYRYGAVVQYIGSLLAGPDSTPSDADRFAEDFFDLEKVVYWSSPHGPLPIVGYADLERIAKEISLPTALDVYEPST